MKIAQEKLLRKYFLTVLPYPVTLPTPQYSCFSINRKAPKYTIIIEITTNIQSSDIDIIVYMSAFPQ